MYVVFNKAERAKAEMKQCRCYLHYHRSGRELKLEEVEADVGLEKRI